MVFLLALLIAMPLTVLIHELGHAVIALYLSRRPVNVEVGVGGPAVQVRIRGLHLTLRARQALLGVGGLASFDPAELSAVSLVLIAVAGPAASAAGALTTSALLAHRPEDAFVPDLLSIATGMGWGLCLFNLVPFRLSARGRGCVMVSDGLAAIRALRHIARHRTARLTRATYDPADDEKALATLHRLARQRVADSSALDMPAALREILSYRPELDAAVNRRRAEAMRLAHGADPARRRAMIRAAMDPGWRG